MGEEWATAITLIDVSCEHVACLKSVHDTADIITCSIPRTEGVCCQNVWEGLGYASSESYERSKGSNLIIARRNSCPDHAWNSGTVKILQSIAWVDSIIVLEIDSGFGEWEYFRELASLLGMETPVLSLREWVGGFTIGHSGDGERAARMVAEFLAVSGSIR
jgi:hypothetical protein